jgi:hypothetical protein
VKRLVEAAVGLGAAAALAVACASSSGGGDGADAAGGDVDAPAPGAGDGLPRGAISFFLSTLCPSGWAPYAEAVGRTIVPSAPGDVGVTAGAPLANNERRAHAHDLTVGVDLPSVSYAGIAGEANHGLSRGGHVDGTTRSDDGAADVPYAQLLVCKKTAAAGDTAPPSGVVAFFETGEGAACPGAWTPAPDAFTGRVLVALPAGGIAGRTFGGAPLASGEERTHSHPVTATLAAASHGIALASNGAANNYAAAGDHATTTTAQPAAAGLPYLQLLACVAP